MHFKPNSYLEDPSEEYAQHTVVFGDHLTIGACSSFKIPGTLPGMSEQYVSCWPPISFIYYCFLQMELYSDSFIL